MQGTAQEGDMSADGLTAGKAADGLIDNRLENGGGEIFLGRTLIDQGLDVGFGKDTAARRDGIQGTISARIAVESCGVGLQQARHLIDKGTRAACADAVHPLFHTAVFKIDDLGIFAAEFDRDIGFGRDSFEGGGYGDNLLDKGDLKVGRQGQAAGSRDDRVDGDVAQLRKGILYKGTECALNVCVMSAVIGKHDFTGGIQNGNFDSRGSDIDSKCIVC